MSAVNIFIIFCAAVFAVMIVYHDRRRHPLRSFAAGAVTGLVSLFAVNYFSESLGIAIPLNTFNICGSAVLGIPYTAAAVIMSCI